MKNGLFPGGLDPEDYFERLHIAYGAPEEVALGLASDQVLPPATDLILQFSPAAPALDDAIRALELPATQVAPALDWARATSASGARHDTWRPSSQQ